MKITLKNLHKATAQQVFNQVAEHLLTQMERSIDIGGNCVYRGPNGLKCATGCLIADDEYDPEMDNGNGFSWAGLISIFNFTDNHTDLIMELQRIHDCFLPKNWKEKLMEVSKKFNLEWKYE